MREELAKFPEIVLEKFAFLVRDYGFRAVGEEAGLVRMESPTLGVLTVFDPRGELDVWVFRLGSESPLDSWTYTGMTGRASLPRLLEIAAEQMRDDPRLLQGDPTFFSRLGADNRRRSHELTAWASGKGPRPDTRKLPG